MTYKAQLVVRARSKEGAAIIDKVKEMASEQDKTYSEMAVELLGLGLNADDDVDAEFATDKVDDADEPEETEEVDDGDDELVEEPESSSALEVDEPSEELVAAVENSQQREAEEDPRAPLPAAEAGPAVDPSLPPEEIVEHYVERRDERGERAAARILVDFFAEAGPAEGGDLKNKLQEQFSEEEYDELIGPIKRTAEYKEYTNRVISQPSPYSEVK